VHADEKRALARVISKARLFRHGTRRCLTGRYETWGHALTIVSGWRTVADTALAFVRCFV